MLNNLRNRNSMPLLSLALLTALALPVAANAGGDNGGGNGGGDEVLFHSLATQIGGWLKTYQADGTLSSRLELAGISADGLVNAYMAAIRTTPDVKFLPQNQLESSCKAGDPGSCLLFLNPSRICVNHGVSSKRLGLNYIRCNSEM